MGKLQVQKVNWWHERLAEWMLANPDRNLKDAAPEFNCTPMAIYIIHNSDAFREHWAKVSGALTKGISDPIIEKCRAVAEAALDGLLDKMQTPLLSTPELLLDTADKMMKRLGYAADKNAAPPQVQVTFNTVSPEALAQARERVHALTAQRVENVPATELLAAPATIGGDA